MRSRAVSLPRLCCASMRAFAAAEAGLLAPLLQPVENVLHLAPARFNPAMFPGFGCKSHTMLSSLSPVLTGSREESAWHRRPTLLRTRP